MKLQEKHKEFAVKCFAKYMKPSEVTNAFIQQFPHDLPKPPLEPTPPNHQKEKEGIDYQLNRDEYVAQNMEKVELRYIETYSNQAEEKLKEDRQKLIEEYKKDFDQKWQMDKKEEYDRECYRHKLDVEKHYREVKAQLKNQLRRLNITHTQFPEKYRKLFSETRQQFFQKYQNQNPLNDENIQRELETIYGYVKNLIFDEKIPKEVTRHANMAHNILKTIASYEQNNIHQKEIETDMHKTKNT